MKNMKKLLQKAMVFTLTAAMLVGTPLTASAAGLADLYQIEDGWGNVTGNADNSRTGTVTATQTNSGILEANATLAGIVLDETNVEMEISDTRTLTASLDWETDAKNEDLEKTLLKKLQWRSSDTAIVALDTKSVEGKFKDGPRDVITLKPKAAGTATVTVSLDSNEHNIHYSASATITVLQYADELKFNDDRVKEDAFTGNTLVLDDCVDRYVDGKLATTSDTLTYALKAASNAATLKNGVLTLKKEGEIQVIAIGKNARSDWYTIKIEKGHNAKTIAFSGTDVSGTKLALSVNKGKTRTVTATVTATKDGGTPCTDKISWSSKKPEIVTVSTTAPMKLTDGKSCEVTLTAISAGKAQVVAKASSGKSATLNVTVSADLTSIEISESAPNKLYSGQTIDLYALANQYFGASASDKANINFTDAGLKWSFVGDSAAQGPMKKVASINAKGVLNIKPDLSVTGGTKEIKVQAANAKKVGNSKPGTIKTAAFTINLEQVNVTEILVNKGTTPMARATANNGKVTQDPTAKNKTDTIAEGGSRIYTLTARGTIGDSEEVTDLDPAVLGWTASGSGKIVKASRNAVGDGVIKAIKKGTATITINSATKKVSGGKTKYVAIKTTFKDKVTAPTKTLTLTVKNTGIAATGKKQTISITPVIQKGSTTNKNNDIVWTATMNGTPLTIDKGKIKNQTFTSADLGAKIVVTASVKDGGPRTSITLTVVQPSKNVEFQVNGTKTTKINDLKTTETTPRVVTAKVNLSPSGVGDPGKENVSKVTYTVNKAGIVRVVDKGDGTIEIEPLTKGSVKITATTLDGKKGSLSLKVLD